MTAALQPDAVVPLELSTQHYLTHVLRRKPGDALLLCNGRGGEWQAEIAVTGHRQIVAVCKNLTRAQQIEPDISLFFALIKRDHLDYLIQKATELGVRALHPVITQHSIPHKLNLDRLNSIAREAAEQSERLTLPVIHPPLPLAQALEQRIGGAPCFACLENGAAEPIMSQLASQRPSALLIGPEGGFSAAEMIFIQNHANMIPVHLGPRILRADTAALAALSCWQAVCGDWPPL